MTTYRRNLLFVSLLVLGGIAALLLVAPLLLNTERYRGMLAARASRLLNREVTAKSLRVHFLPRPGATVRDLTVADREPWSGSFIEAERLEVTMKLLPLLRGELQVKEIRMHRPRIRLARGREGWNLEDLIRPAARPATAEAQRPEGTRSVNGQPALPVLVAGALTVREGTLLFESSAQDRNVARLEIRDLNLDAPAPHPQGPLRLHISGRLPGETSGSFDLSGSVRPEEGDRLPIEARLKVRGLNVAQLALHLGLSSSTAVFTGTLDLEGEAVGEWPRIGVKADVDLQQVGVALGKETGKAPGDKAWLQAKGGWDGEGIEISEANLRWKDRTITGRLTLANLQAPMVRFELNSPDLAADTLAAIAAEFGAGTGSSNTPRTPRFSEDPAHTKRFTGLQVEGRLKSGALRWGGVVLTSAEGEVRYAGGLLTIPRLRGGFYGGSLLGDAALDLRGRLPHTSMTARLEGVQTEPLLKALHEERWVLRGIMTLVSRLEFTGPPAPGALTAASGQGDVVVTEGRLTGYPPLERLSQTFSPILKEAGISSTLNEFDRLSAHLTLDNGILRTKDLLLERERAKLLAAGSMNLQDQRLDFDVTARVAKATLEAKVGGTPANPMVTLQLGRIEQRVKTEVGKIMKGERGEALGKVLKELFPR